MPMVCTTGNKENDTKLPKWRCSVATRYDAKELTEWSDAIAEPLLLALHGAWR
jgi:hypothetical protein